MPAYKYAVPSSFLCPCSKAADGCVHRLDAIKIRRQAPETIDSRPEVVTRISLYPVHDHIRETTNHPASSVFKLVTVRQVSCVLHTIHVRTHGLCVPDAMLQASST